MATDAVIAAFRRLHTNDSRQEAVEALVGELTSHERRALQSITAGQSFQCDIIGRLPLELVAQVFAELDTSTPFRLQCVSKQWHHVLRSSDVLKKSLLSAGTPDLQGADYSVFQLKAKHLHAYLHGKPKHYVRIVKHIQKADYTILVEDTIIWSTLKGGNHDSRILYLFNIKNWTLHTLNGDARENIQQVVASNRIVAFTSSNSTLCYVSDLEARNKKKFRVLNPVLFQALACRESTVACAGILEDHALVYIWNYDSQQGRSFKIDFGTHLLPYPRQGHQHGLALLLQPKDERIVVFTDQRSPAPSEDWPFNNNPPKTKKSLASGGRDTRTIIYSQYTYTGDCTFSSEMTMDDIEDLSYNTFQTLNNSLFPVDSQGKFRVMIGSRYLHTAACWLQFDERLNMFTEPRPATHPGQMYTSSDLSWWNNTFFSSKILPVPTQSSEPRVSVLTQLGTNDTPEDKDKPLLLFRYGPNEALEATVGPFAIVANDKYVVRTLTNTFHIMCYQTPPDFTSGTTGRFFDIGGMKTVEAQHMPQLI